jgi:hypothetical protein
MSILDPSSSGDIPAIFNCLKKVVNEHGNKAIIASMVCP